MTTAIDNIFWENSRRYGSRRVLKSLKEQGVERPPCGCSIDLQDANGELFNGYYNVCRLHSSFGYRWPIDFENQFYQTVQLNSQK
jgi:transposase InsO family protein